MKKNIVIIGTIVVSGCVIGILMYRNKKYQVIIENLDTIDKEFSLKDTTLNFKPYETGNTREQKMIEIYNSNITMANTLSEPMKSDVIRVMKTWFLTLDREAYLTRIELPFSISSRNLFPAMLEILNTGILLSSVSFKFDIIAQFEYDAVILE